ncbi:hypothetical protein C8Q78DRAFT_1186282 [Trametes maxima]|nr:hypothetical protein C8Q78DRAFT_1186282 [Trametes maxima]
MRYSICILGGSGNQARPEISNDIVSAILKTRADKHNPAVYWPREEQEKRLEAAFQKWATQGVWNAAAAKTHKEQMKHVKRGCLTRPRNDVSSDGSQIEGSHRAWNGLQRSHASGLEMLTHLSHDHVLRRNHRIDMDSRAPMPFAITTYGSHHIRLVDHTAKLWNKLLQDKKHIHLLAGLCASPMTRTVQSGESFGIVRSQFAAGYHYMIEVKEEDMDGLLDLSSQPPHHARRLLESINIDPALLSQPLPSTTSNIDGDVSTLPSELHASRLAGTTPNPPHTLPVNSMDDTDTTHSPRAIVSKEIKVELVSSTEDAKSLTPALTLTPPVTAEPPSANAITVLLDGGHCSDANIGDEEIVIISHTPAPLSSLRGCEEQHGNLLGRRPFGNTRHDELHAKRKASITDALGLDDVRHSASNVKRVKLSPAGAQTSTSAQHQSPNAFACDTLHPPADHDMPGRTASPHRSGDIQDYFVAARRTAEPKHVVTRPSLDEDVKLPQVHIVGLSPSQRLFSLATGLNPLSTTISSGDEFFLFMNLRAEHKWASYNMTPQKWVEAATLYNTALEKTSWRLGHMRWTARKTPRALMDKLGEIEPMVLRRLQSGDYRSKESGSEDFWHKHCHAVPLIKGGNDDLRTRKLNTCTRCKTIMWPGPRGSPFNHKRSFCSDGVRMNPQVTKTKDGQSTVLTEELPPWPQPSGIFEGGNRFNPTVFLSTVSQLYAQMITHQTTGGRFAMEYLAFAEMLHKRTIVVPAATVGADPAAVTTGAVELTDLSSDAESADMAAPTSSQVDDAMDSSVLFWLFDSLDLGPCPSYLLTTYKGHRYLSITPLQSADTLEPREEEEEEEGEA